MGHYDECYDAENERVDKIRKIKIMATLDLASDAKDALDSFPGKNERVRLAKDHLAQAIYILEHYK